MIRLLRKETPLADEAGPQTVAGRDPKPERLLALLIITAFPERFRLPPQGLAFAVVRTCREGMEHLDRSRFDAIFCDMGQLGPAESGFRFANSLKSRADVPPVFLMTEQVTVYDETYSKRQGAVGLVARSQAAVHLAVTGLKAGTLPMLAAATSAANTPFPDDRGTTVSAAGLGRVKLGLRKYVGPAADDVVDRSLRSLLKRQPQGASLIALVNAVAATIEDSRERDRFLAEFGA